MSLEGGLLTEEQISKWKEEHKDLFAKQGNIDLSNIDVTLIDLTNEVSNEPLEVIPRRITVTLEQLKQFVVETDK